MGTRERDPGAHEDPGTDGRGIAVEGAGVKGICHEAEWKEGSPGAISMQSNSKDAMLKQCAATRTKI